MLKNVDKLKSADIPFSFRATIVASDRHLMDTVRFFESQRIPYYLVPCFNSGNDNSSSYSEWSESVLEKFSKEYDEVISFFMDKIRKRENVYCYSFIACIQSITEQYFSRYSCGVGVNMLSVADNGRIFPCMNFAPHPETEIGNLHDGINEELRKKYLPINIETQEDCRDCLIRYQCCGGCVAERYDSNTYSIALRDYNLCKLKVLMMKKEIVAYQTIKIKYSYFLDNLPEIINIEL